MLRCAPELVGFRELVAGPVIGVAPRGVVRILDLRQLVQVVVGVWFNESLSIVAPNSPLPQSKPNRHEREDSRSTPEH